MCAWQAMLSLQHQPQHGLQQSAARHSKCLAATAGAVGAADFQLEKLLRLPGSDFEPGRGSWLSACTGSAQPWLYRGAPLWGRRFVLSKFSEKTV